jgi:hypothetical protein
MIIVKRVKSFDGAGIKASLEQIKANISPDLNYAIEISESEKIIKLNIPFSELYRKCSDNEWIEIKNFINKALKK